MADQEQEQLAALAQALDLPVDQVRADLAAVAALDPRVTLQDLLAVLSEHPGAALALGVGRLRRSGRLPSAE